MHTRLQKLRLSLRAIAAKALYPALGVGMGLAVAGAFVAHVRALSPHAALLIQAPDRVYVDLDCAYSQRALDTMARAPGTREVVTIPTDLSPTPERDKLCGEAVAALRRDGSLVWGVLPSSYLCGRLVREAREWLSASMGDEPRIPAWVVDGELIEPGFSDESLALLRNKGFFAEESATP